MNINCTNIGKIKFEELKQNELFYSFIHTLTLSKLTNVSCAIYFNTELEKDKILDLFKQELVYVYYAPKNKSIKSSILFLGYIPKENSSKIDFLNKNFPNNSNYITNYIEILTILSNDSLLINSQEHYLFFTNQQFFERFLDFIDGTDTKIYEFSGFINGFWKYIITPEIKKQQLEIININLEYEFENLINYLNIN